jgi:hypothetical protein
MKKTTQEEMILAGDRPIPNLVIQSEISSYTIYHGDRQSAEMSKNLQDSSNGGKESSRSNVDFQQSPSHSSQARLWQKRFDELARFHRKHGHCNVPHNWAESPALSKWVKRQRYQCKLKNEGKHSTLTDERKNTLEKLGFAWNSRHKAMWEQRLSELLEFKQLHGHCNVPSSYHKNHSLSVWVQCQRRQHKLFMAKSKQSHMNQERIEKLEAGGFLWNPGRIIQKSSSNKK